MAKICKYVILDEDGNSEEHEYDSMQEAIAAGSGKFAVIERTYIYDDSALVWTSTGSDIWLDTEEPEEKF